jgi:PHD/YefM family antitoxin component YafN of YafNO toxin-antitoxin module
MAITTLSSREFNQNASAAKKAAENGPVFITDRGRTAHVLLTITEYQKITHTGKSILDLLAMPEGVDICEDFDSLIPRSRELARAADLS